MCKPNLDIDLHYYPPFVAHARVSILRNVVDNPLWGRCGSWCEHEEHSECEL